MKEISVVIPSYNRGHLLQRTLPTYLSKKVGELILVDDCSIDNTKEVVKELQKKYPQIIYCRMEKNMKQGAAKNRGIQLAKFPYIYFGDDDSVLYEDSLELLLNTLKLVQADGVAARALYMNSEKDIMLLDRFIDRNTIYISDSKQIVDLSRMTTGFRYSVKSPIQVPITPACILIKSDLAKKYMFDENYKGNAYREETDFTIRLSLDSHKLWYDSRAIQINFPIKSVGRTGAHASTRFKWYISSIKNNTYFLNKNYARMRLAYDLPYSISVMKMQFILKMIVNYVLSVGLIIAKSFHLENFVRNVYLCIKKKKHSR